MFTNDPYSFVGAAMVKEVYQATRPETAVPSQAATEREPKRRYLVGWLLARWRSQQPAVTEFCDEVCGRP
jgi:hypothetical protein